MGHTKASTSRARANGHNTSPIGRAASRNDTSANGHSPANSPADPGRLNLDAGPTSIDQLFDLQRSAGNAAISAIFTEATSLQRQAVAYAPDEATTGVPAGAPADIDVGFNALDRSHRLREAIDSTQMYFKSPPKDASPFQYHQPELVRHIDFAVVVAQLEGLTSVQVDMIDREYQATQKRTLRQDIFGGGESGASSDLTSGQVKRLSSLMAGTRAAPGEDPELARLNQLDADAAELHEILAKKKSEAGVERVMAILRSHAEKGGISSAYERIYKGESLGKALGKLGMENALRAGMLLVGSPLAADVIKVSNQRARLGQIDEELEKLKPMYGTMEMVPRIGPGADWHKKVKKLGDERTKIVADIIATLELAGDEARELADDPVEAELEAGRRMNIIAMGDSDALAADVGGGKGQDVGGSMQVRALMTGAHGRRVAGAMRQLHAAGKLTPTAVAEQLRGLRVTAEVEAQRLGMGKEEWEVAVAERELADQYFEQLRTAWDADPQGPRFDEIVGKGSKIEAERNRALAKGLGHMEPVDEVIYALSGSRKDLDTVKRVLRDMHAEQIAELKTKYQARTNRSLDADLFGEAPTKAGGENLFLPGHGYIKKQGKAAGSNRLVLEDFFQRATREGGWEEIQYLSERAEREYEYTIENRGVSGWWRDKWGNEARSLLDETIKEVRAIRKQYAALVMPVSFGFGLVMRPDQADTPKALGLLLRMRHARATIRGDRAGYEKATAELRAKFQAAAAFAIQMALSAVLGPAVGALIRLRGLTLGVSFARWARNTSVSIASTMGSNYVVYGNEYNLERVKKDIAGGLVGSIGSAGAELLVPRIAYGLSQQLGSKLHPEITKMAGTYASTAAGEALEGNSPLISMEKFVQEHLMGKVQEAGTGAIQKGAGLEADPYGPGGSKAGEAGGAGAGPTGKQGAGEGHPAKAGDQDDSDFIDEADEISMQLPEPGGAAPAKGKSAAPDKAGGVGTPKKADDGTLIRFPPPPPEVTFKPNVPDTESVRATREAQARRAAENPLDYETIKKGASADPRARARAAEFSPLYGEWHSLSTVEKRRARVEEIVNQHLAAAGLPRVEVSLSNRTSGGSLNPKTGKIDLSEAAFADNDISIASYAALVDTAVHEARHALHHFRSIRAAIMENVFDASAGVPAHWVAAAREANAGTRPAEPLMPLSPKYNEALSIYDQTHGSGAKERVRVIRERKARKKEYTDAKDKLAKLTKGTPEYKTALQAARAARAKYWAAHNKYVALPQEIDAMRRGGATRVAMEERLTLEQQITRTEVASVAAEERYKVLDGRYRAAQAAASAEGGGTVSLSLARAYQKARNRHLAAEKKLQLQRAKLASLGAPSAPAQVQSPAAGAPRDAGGADIVADEADAPTAGESGRPAAEDISSRFDLSETESAGQSGQVAIVDPSVSRLPPKDQLKPQEVATLDRVVLLNEFAGRTFRASTDRAYDFIDSKGFKYDALGAGARAQYQTIDRSFLDQITRHVRKQGLDYTIIDMTGYSAQQIRVVRMYVDLYHGTDTERIIRIGF